MFSISILEARTIIRTINRTYGTDLSGLAMASFRFSLSEIMQAHNIRGLEILLSRLNKDPEFFETFIRDISVGSPDMFRDPDFWIYFRDQLLPEVLKSIMYPEIIIPESVTGNELYSSLVMLREAKLDYRVDLVVTCRNDRIRDQILQGRFSNISYKNSLDNYEVFHPGSSFEQYTETRNGIRYLKPELLEGVEIRVESPEQIHCSDKTAIILYRNRMIYQNTGMQYKKLRHLLGIMQEGVCLVTGIQEAIDGYGLEEFYTTVSDDLKIYTRKNAD